MREVQAFFLAFVVAGLVRAQDIQGFRFDLKTLGGQRISEQTFKKNVLIVDVWGTWCPPCRKAVPVLEDLYRKYKQYGLEIVGLNYERGAGDPAKVVRKFAARNGLTYHLALGTPAVRSQIPGFRGYPTMLYFNKGLVHDHTEVGFNPMTEPKKMERWVRKALGLESNLPGVLEDEEEAEEKPEEAPEEEKPEPLPEGVIFKPGEGDTGFDFTETDADGKRIAFSELRGHRVVLALTSTWDGEAEKTAKLLNELHEEFTPKGVSVLAASLELARQRPAKVKAIKAFASRNHLSYRIIPAGLGFQKKIHLFSGMPLILVFDEAGKLILRRSGHDEKVRDAVKAALR